MWRLLFAQYDLNLSDDMIILAAYESLALRLFLGLDKDDKPPHPTTLGKFRFGRLDVDLYLEICLVLVDHTEEKGLLDKDERQIYHISHLRSDTRPASIVYLSLQARQKAIKQIKKIDEDYGKELG